MSDTWPAFLQSRGAQFDNGAVSRFGDAPALNTDGISLVDLSHRGWIDVDGADAAAFLHAQLTNDVVSLADGTAQWTGWCSPKGRLLATFLLWRQGGAYRLWLPMALRQAIQKRLQMFVLRSKVTLSDAGAGMITFGLAGNAAHEWAGRVLGLYSLPLQVAGQLGAVNVLAMSDRRVVICAPAADAVAWWDHLRTAGAFEAGEAAWRRTGIDDGILDVQPETQDQFVPQMANFDLIGGVNFRKGCYPGQEIVARTQYRGILKRRMVRIETAATLARGQTVFAAEFGDQAAGMVADAVAVAPGNTVALVVAQIESIRANSLRSADGLPLNVLTLPYPIAELD